ncbi:hypothetical protein Tco_0476668, partial [Tanacetum coccineum]
MDCIGLYSEVSEWDIVEGVFGGELVGEGVSSFSLSMKTSSKLDDRSIQMVYLGSEPGSKAYRLFDPITKKIY